MHVDQPFGGGEFVIAERGARVEGRVVDVESPSRQRSSRPALELRICERSDVSESPSILAPTKNTLKSKSVRSTKVAVALALAQPSELSSAEARARRSGSAAGGGAGAGKVLATRGKPVVLPRRRG